MKNLKKIYFYFTFNKINIITLFLSLLSLFLIFLFYKLDISIYEYEANINYYTNVFLNDNLSYICLISSITLLLLIAIDYITNANRFDIIFIPKYSKEQILFSKLNTYLFIAINYSLISYLCLLFVGVIKFDGFVINFKIVRIYFYLLLYNIEVIVISLFLVLTIKNGFCAIITIILYFLSSLIYESNKYIANILLMHIDASSNMFFACFISILIIIILICILLRFNCGIKLCFKNKRLKIIKI